MEQDIFSKGELSSVDPSAVNSYLRSHGWQKYGSYADIGNIYYLGDKAQQILAPTSADFIDYADVVYRAINELAKLEDRSAYQVYKDLKTIDSDIIRFHVPTRGDIGSISLANAKILTEESYKLLASAACSAVSPRLVHRGRNNNEVVQYMEQLQMGQTEKGSFVLTLLSKVPPVLSPRFSSEFGEDEIFSRKVVRTLTTGLLFLKRGLAAVNGKDADISAFEEGVESGVSADLCEAVANLPQKQIDISVSWALVRPQTMFHCSFNQADKELLAEVGSILRKTEPRTDEVLTGFVVKLDGDNPPVNGGRATFKFLIDDKLKAISADFDADLYQRVNDAYINHKQVELEGDISLQEGRSGRQLKNLRNFRIVPD